MQGRDGEGLAGLLAPSQMRLEHGGAVFVALRGGARRCRIALCEERRRLRRRLRVLVRSLRRRVDQLAVFGAGDVPDARLVQLPEQRRRGGQQRERGADSLEDWMQARADHGPALDVATDALFSTIRLH
jgi:hypothetical protein